MADWPISRAVTDAAEVTCEWLGANRSEVRVVDVRERDDFNDELGHVPESENVPLTNFSASLKTWDRNLPVVFVCKMGIRSGRVAVELEKTYNFTRVACLKGGLFSWKEANLPLVRD
eukprot:TRINITY_DN5685_c0_g1_i2.p1 TRINITY_DN5685_c0_g1~~TRINITY_DN5685_c0_g1_i2.p1  ORF type:complete len:117 (+),score=30.56 TRINITY_DN5685_c0_g1_i2:37-387(+)